MKIGIIVGSIRQGRAGTAVAQWVLERAQGREADYEVLELADFDVPLLTSATVPGAANKQYDSPQVTAWSQAIDALDGYIFVTPEYNHGVPGGFKNAFDSLGSEWARKPVAFVSYGADNGVRAVEHWRQIVANFHMVGVRQQVSLSRFREFGDDGLALLDRRDGELDTLFDQLESMAATLAA